MKKTFIFFVLFFSFMSLVKAQPWVGHNDTLARTLFNLPTSANTANLDSSKLAMYACEVDSILGLQVHILDSAYLDPTDTMVTNALINNSYDTLRAFAQLLLLATNSTLTSVADITVSGKQGLEIGIEYNELASDIPTLTFMRYFLLNGKFIVYTISGSSTDLMRLMTYKSTFFSSISFY